MAEAGSQEREAPAPAPSCATEPPPPDGPVAEAPRAGGGGGGWFKPGPRELTEEPPALAEAEAARAAGEAADGVKTEAPPEPPKSPLSGPVRTKQLSMQNLIFARDDISLTLEDSDTDVLAVGNMIVAPPVNPRFLNHYTADELSNAFLSHRSKFQKNLGKTIGDVLRERGYTSVIFDIDISDCFVHRLHLYDTIREQSRLLGQLFMRVDAPLYVGRVKSASTPSGDRGAPDLYLQAFEEGLQLMREKLGTTPINLAIIEWLRMHDPARSFSPDETPLPGQLHPSLGIGREVSDFIYELALKRGREGILNVPEHWHNAYMYTMSGRKSIFKFLNAGFGAFFWSIRDAVMPDVQKRGLNAVAWAIARGRLMYKGNTIVHWVPHELVCPISRRLTDYVESRAYNELFHKFHHPEDFAIDWTKDL